MEGKTPYLRGTFRMLGLAAEVINSDPRTKPVMILQMTWSAGDHIVAVEGVKTINDLKGKTIAIQQGGPHIGMLDDALTAANMTWDDIKPFQDASSSLQQAEEEIAQRETQLADLDKKIGTYQAELQRMQRDVQKLKEEKHEAVAETQIAAQMEAVNATLAGLAEDTSDKDLQAAREARKKAVAKAKVTADLAGNDAELAESEYLKYAQDTVATDEFASLTGLDDAPDKDLDPARLPETE